MDAAYRMQAFTSAVIVGCHCKPAKRIVMKILNVKAMFNTPKDGAITQQLLSASNHAKNIIAVILVLWEVLVDPIMVDAM